ncbi:hypothetical protein [Sulfuricurvum sp.]|uniref:hypothetical protein n=1 Tax=Sulfuricurvum sp. TaxID=2025608 RepID=UPI00261CDF36|nr:hypothetical protein [Sulfuricurvum sp.]MDD3598030.1 hypothetical protein [Sulfuricurvum sp.]
MKHIILLILLTLGVWGQEVGVPYLDYAHINVKEFVGGRKVAVSTVNNKLIKLEAKGKFSIWNLAPFEKIDEFLIPYANWFYLSEDMKKIIVSTYTDLAPPSENVSTTIVWDLEKKKPLIEFPYESHGAIMTDQKLFIMEENSCLHVYDLKTFKELDRIELNVTTILRRTFSATNYGKEIKDSPHSLDISKDKIIIRYANNIVILDTKTLRILKSIKFDDLWATYSYMDVEKDILYYGDKYQMDVKTLDIKESKDTSQNQIYEKLDNLIGENHFYRGSIPNPKHKIFAYGKKQYIRLIDSKTLNVYGTFSEFTNNAWIIITPDGYFDGSPESRKYLTMKTLFGELVPIDDATYYKFNKKINIGEKK